MPKNIRCQKVPKITYTNSYLLIKTKLYTVFKTRVQIQTDKTGSTTDILLTTVRQSLKNKNSCR